MRPQPDAFAAVMATGIVSIAAEDHHYQLISDALAVLAAIAFAVLLAVAAATRWDYRDPDVTLRLFTFVAACAVLASRVPSLLWPLGGVAGLVWLVLFPLSARNMKKRGWVTLREKAHGGWELASVATSGLAIVAAPPLSVVLWVLAVIVYCVMTSLILWALAAGMAFAPDHWILMGGLAIATLAATQVHVAAPVTAVTWALATAWIPVLFCAHLVQIVRRADARRVSAAWWAMVFPLGMYASATQATALEMHWPVLTTVSLVFFWIALACWLLVALTGGYNLFAGGE